MLTVSAKVCSPHMVGNNDLCTSTKRLTHVCDNNVGQYYKVVEIYCTLYIAYHYVNDILYCT